MGGIGGMGGRGGIEGRGGGMVVRGMGGRGKEGKDSPLVTLHTSPDVNP